MRKKLTVAVICLIIMLLSIILKRENRTIDEASDILIMKMMNVPEAVAVFNLDEGVFV